ncbi:hypothetical protein [Gluconobacter oxydans]|uniref:hypothetical protein n=1 Tax=Gluconobacter oxydans TaxID=442 RepID=UPI000780FC53|nr:hypothetical protein [Gluconobacter oxydans]KXV65626.1 hypothetical protein AD950_04040 [Gluconobacter oxydans]
MLGISPKRAGISPKARCSAMSDALTERFQDMVNEEVRDRRGLGLKGAFREVARLFGLTERRVRACWHHEIRSVTAGEWEAVRQARIQTLKARQLRLQQQLDRLNDRGAA